MRRTALSTLFAALFGGLLVACGGGGGSDATESDNQAQPPIVNDDAQRAQAMIENCGNDAIDVLLSTLDVFAFVPGSTTPPITLLPLEGNVLPFTADINDDMQVDLQGVIRFVDGMGQPIMPFTQEQLTGGIGMLVPLLSSLPSGAKMIMELAPAGDVGIESAQLTISFLAGLPVSLDGFVNYFSDPCMVSMTFVNVPTLSLLGEYPTLPVNVHIQENGDVLDGTITLDGTSSARIDGTLNGGEPMAFELDLATGAASLLGNG